MQPLPHASGSAEGHLRVSLASGGHALELTGYGLEGVAEPEALSVVAAGQDSGVVRVVVHDEESLSLSDRRRGSTLFVAATAPPAVGIQSLPAANWQTLW